MAKDDGPETLGPSTSSLFHALAADNKHIKNRKIVRFVSLYGHCVDALNLRPCTLMGLDTLCRSPIGPWEVQRILQQSQAVHLHTSW